MNIEAQCLLFEHRRLWERQVLLQRMDHVEFLARLINWCE